jgi:hypothetical protein
MQDYKKTFTVNKLAADVYAAISLHIAHWWSNDLEGAAAHAGDSFTIAFGKTKKTFKIIEAIPNRLVVWECIKAYINNPSLENKAEWVGTKMIWTLNAAGQNTSVTFLHQGLNQKMECYDLCEAGWNMFLDSLQVYLTTGKGMPYLKTTSAV